MMRKWCRNHPDFVYALLLAAYCFVWGWALCAMCGCRTIERAARHELERKVVEQVQAELDVFVERKLTGLFREYLPHGMSGVIALLVAKLGLGRLKKAREVRDARV